MQIGNTNYSLKPGNWNLRTPGTLKLICDALLFLSLASSTLWPEIDWVLKVGVFIKLLSNFISEHIPAPVPTQTEE